MPPPACSKKDSQFWVVQTQGRAEGVSGLGTLLSRGLHRTRSLARRARRAVNTPCWTSRRSPGGRQGLRLSQQPRCAPWGRLPISYQGFTRPDRGGQVPAREERWRYQLFITPYDILVSSNSRFWLTPGFEVSKDEGMKVKMDSLESLLDGGITMGLPRAGHPVSRSSRWTASPCSRTRRRAGR